MRQISFEFKAEELKPFIAMPVYEDINPTTVKSMIETLLALRAKQVKFDIMMNCGTSIIDMARNMLADKFLQSKCDRIFWIDADIVWSVDDFMTILGLSSMYDVVGAAYRFKGEELKFSVMVDGDADFVANEHGMIKVAGSGMGFSCMRRKVIETMAASSRRMKLDRNKPDTVAQLFQCGVRDDGCFYGEDLDFFARLKQAGFDYWVYPHVKLGHVGRKIYEGALIEMLKEVDAGDAGGAPEPVVENAGRAAS